MSLNAIDVEIITKLQTIRIGSNRSELRYERLFYLYQFESLLSLRIIENLCLLAAFGFPVEFFLFFEELANPYTSAFLTSDFSFDDAYVFLFSFINTSDSK